MSGTPGEYDNPADGTSDRAPRRPWCAMRGDVAGTIEALGWVLPDLQ
jgi:hypothetical protein